MECAGGQCCCHTKDTKVVGLTCDMDFGSTPEGVTFRHKICDFVKNEPPESFPTQGKDEDCGFGATLSNISVGLGEKAGSAVAGPLNLVAKVALFFFDELAYHWMPAEDLFRGPGILPQVWGKGDYP